METSVVRRPPFGSNPLVGERGTDTQRRILGAALEIFAEAGFAESRRAHHRPGRLLAAGLLPVLLVQGRRVLGLATQLGEEMVALAESLERVTPGREGLGRLTEWVGRFTALHEAWAPVFTSFQAASHHEPQAPVRRHRRPHGRGGPPGLRPGADPARAALVNNLISVLIRSFYAEQIPADSSAQPWSKGWPNCSTASWPGRSRA